MLSINYKTNKQNEQKVLSLISEYLTSELYAMREMDLKVELILSDIIASFEEKIEFEEMIIPLY